MRWEGRRQSTNVEDRRNVGRQVVVGGGLLTLALMMLMMFLGADPQQVAQLAPDFTAPAPRQAQPQSPADERRSRMVKTVLAETEDVWSKLFPSLAGRRYTPPTLVMFTDQVKSACGFASAAAGPFYCPLDKKVYIDLAFFNELERRFRAPGEFAQAYVIAHEIGHHVQNQLGITSKVQSMRQRMSERDYNKLSVRMELQADFLAGVWAHHVARYAGILDESDIRAGVNAASAIGDDRIQRQTQGYVVPDAFTHGSGDQRVRWFLYGLKTGDPTLMDRAFEVDNP
jgi:predicted metalloprotease